MVIILNKCHYSVLSRIKEILLEISVRVGFFLSRAKKVPSYIMVTYD